MSEALAGLDLQRKIEMIEAGLTRRVIPYAGIEYIVEKSWVQSIHRGVPSALSNRVWFSDLADQEANDRIKQTLATYQSLQVPFMWMLSPNSRPSDLAVRLVAHGFRLTARVRGMLADVDSLMRMGGDAAGTNICVEMVNESNMYEWIEVVARGWEMAQAAEDAMRSAMKVRFAEDCDKMIEFLARCEGIACGASTLERYENFGLFMNGFVKSEYRGRGVFRAMVIARAAWLKERNVPLAAIHALEETAAPLALRMGFEDVCKISAYSSP